MEESIRLLKDATFEIQRLRRENELHRARLDMFDSVMTVLNTEPKRQGYGMSPDVVFEINKFIDAQPK